MTDGFTVRYAVRMPNGALYRPFFGDDHDHDPMTFDRREYAERFLVEIRRQAALVGVTNWCGCVVQQLCSPFTVGDPGFEFAEQVAEWLREQGV
jgi:hypothetical protein